MNTLAHRLLRRLLTASHAVKAAPNFNYVSGHLIVCPPTRKGTARPMPEWLKVRLGKAADKSWETAVYFDNRA